MKKNILFFSILIITTLFVYKDLFQTFYQQDEWWSQGHMITEGIKGYFSHYSLGSIIAGGGRPLFLPTQYIFYNYFPFQIAPFALFAILFHLVNSIMFFILMQKISKNTFIAALSALFFTTASVAQQAVSWAAASTTTLPSAFFVMLAMYIYLVYLDKKNKKLLYSSLLSGIIGYLFKESAVIIFIFLPFMYVLFNKEKHTFIHIVKKHIVFFVPILYIVAIKIIDIRFTPKQAVFFLTHNSPDFFTVALRLLLYPMESISQLFIQDHIMFSLANHFVSKLYPRLAYSPFLEVSSETLAADMLSFVISMVFLCAFAMLYIYHRKERRTILFGLLLTMFSFAPFALLVKGNAYLESRYFYIGVAGGGVLFAVFFDYVRKFLSKTVRLPVYLIALFVCVVAGVYFYYQAHLIHQSLQMQVEYATERKKILSSIILMYPKLPSKTIFYITGSNEYYIPGNKIPFQEGTGYTLMVWYYLKGSIPKELIIEDFLWDLASEGYKEVNNNGFGHFWNIKELKKTVKEKSLSKNQVIALYYDAATKHIVDITPDIRKQL